ncbi:MAG: hypothetical protein US45_C0055G0003 [Candidatus Nomurabacteria bacterium GW2011_GWA1_37_20]|uniref:Thrombospondin type 3 repeat superfamily protein n=2 Tax=Parcubacteria group TaxID=1794811 RepID=A0A0G0HW31_9BACT|nr:MAG: hypothetical protein US41_C0011G0004 [Parcubacteria group bacterium GW2011_GWB1_37_13]KKQ29909.1 MAG: hypothetical protein US45_C0055G0003 [Candidatus Nomurabacteria bacterium GW2011_GWA1_37_20]KKQ47348.1 MAG: hypothetical protein US65_C0011G0018 [Candidatus Yanofskybacteria bacterium GW2011_GWC2_37_9]
MVFAVALFLLKTTSVFENKETYKGAGQKNGLTYGNITIKDLVNKDTDGDGILDWEEGLWGTDPTKKETTPGTPDKVAIENLKKQTGQNQQEQGLPLLKNGDNQSIENLTQTDQFSRELFSTIATLNQNGIVDQATIDKLGASLAEKIQNPIIRKVFLISDIKTINDNSVQAFINYNNALNSIFQKYPTTYSVLDVLQEFIIDENSVDVSVLSKLNPIIEQSNKVMTAMVKMNVPQSLSVLHLNFINTLQRLVENLSDIKLYDNDSIVALGGISKYKENTTQLESDLNNLVNVIDQKLKN